MRKLMAIAVATILLVFGMVMTANAAEYVYYENDFSNPDTLADFTQYRGVWGIVDGQLMLTDIGDVPMDQQCFILYTKDAGIDKLTDYILEVDMMNIQTQAGPIVRSNTASVNNELATNGTLTTNSFYGYLFFVSFTGEKAAIGRGNGTGGWAGNLKVSGNIMAPGTNIHLKCIVDGESITYIVTDLGTGAELFNHTLENAEWGAGSFGFRSCIMNSGLTNLGMLGYDNLKITATGTVGDWLAAGKTLEEFEPGVSTAPVIPAHTQAIEVTVPEVVKVESSKLDATKTEYVFYQNDFSDPATIADFTQYRGKWEIKNGGLYYAEVTSAFEAASNFSFILYTGNHDANLLKNYTVEADLMNSQTAAGVISHADLAQANSVVGGNGFYGYLSFIGNNGTQGAVGYSNWEGGWAGNLKVGANMETIYAGGNYHLKVVHQDGMFTFTLTAVGSDEVIWEDTESDADWPNGSFGFRMRNALDERVNLNNAYWDNLKVTVHGTEAVLLNAGYHPNAEIVGTLDTPVATTATPVVTTAAPVVTTPAPVVTTAAPVVVTTAAPVETTVAPVETTVVPGETTVAPAETTEAPVETTVAPVETTVAPVETTVAPVETTEAPVETTEAPAQTTAPTTAPAEDGAPVGLIVGIIAAVVVIAAIVVVVLKKKKN